MIVLAEESWFIGGVALPGPVPAVDEISGAASLAHVYAAAISAYWRGGDDGQFFAWLAGCRRAGVAPPDRSPTAVSPHGAGGRGITWFDVPGAVVGVVPGVSWGYRVPPGSAPPPVVPHLSD